MSPRILFAMANPGILRLAQTYWSPWG
ncbi:hypothetical protein BCEP27_20936 [Burkholderia cepacia]